MSLRTRILLLVLLAILAPTLAFAIRQWVHRDQAITDARRNLGELAQNTAENLEDKVKGTVQLLHGLSRAPDLDSTDVAECSAFLAGVLARYPQYTGLLTLTPAGDLHCDSLRSGRKLNVATRDYFRQVAHTLAPAFDAVVGGLTGIAVLQVAYPVLDRSGKLKYVLLASLNLSQYAESFAASNRHSGVVIRIWSRKGLLMASKPEDGNDKLIGADLAASELFRFAASARARGTADLPGAAGNLRVWGVGVLPADQGGVRITLGIRSEDLMARINRDLRVGLEVLGGVCLLTFALAWLIAEIGIRRQAARIVDMARRVAAGDLHARIGAPYPRGELGEVMVVLDRTVQAVQTQRAQLELGSRDLLRANRMLMVLSGINSLIVRVRDRTELFEESCRIAVQTGHFSMAWIGMLESGGATLEPVAWAGQTRELEEFIRGRQALARQAPVDDSLTGRALRTEKLVFLNDTHGDADFGIRSEHVGGAAARSLAILPLSISGKVVGLMKLYADETGFFDEPELKLLRELAGDISFALEHIQKSERLSYLAYYDANTGLANSDLFLERLAKQMSGATGGKLALFVLDVERFKSINDAIGREGGDKLIRQIADRLAGPDGDPGHLARIGPDRFAVLLPGLQGEEEVARAGEEMVLRCFGAPFCICGSDIRVSVKYGIAMFPGDGLDAATLFRNAEAALKMAKAGGDRFLFHTRQMTERAADNLTLENQLRLALERDEFVLHYQPKVDLESGAMVGLEALIRWRSPALGLVPPIRFIPLLEETGLILDVGAWALKQAVADHRTWTEAGLRPPRIAVNVSPIQLRHRDFVGTIRRAIAQGVSPVGIDLEITESVIMQDVEATIGKLRDVCALGVKIAIDDFGTGYSSLAYLTKLPVATLKIDRAFVQAIAGNANTATLVQTIISMAHAMGLGVVAEGVETEDQARRLRSWKCDEMQGYLFSRPVPAEALVRLLREQSPSGIFPPVLGYEPDSASGVVLVE